MSAPSKSAPVPRVRTYGLLFQLAAEALAIVSFFLTWWTVYRGDEVFQVIPGDAPGRNEGRIVVLAAIFAFFFTSYDLVADADFQLPSLLASGVALGAAGYALYDVYWSSSTLSSIVEQVVKAGGDTAAVSTTGTGSGGFVVEQLRSVRIRLGAGLILAVVATADMFAAAIYLTVFARRVEADS